MSWTEVVDVVLLAAGALAFLAATLFGIAGVVGLYRFPDPYSRLQGGSLAGTTAVFSVFAGCLLLSSDPGIALKVVVIMFFFLVSSPTGSHIVAKTMWDKGLVPWKGRRSP